MRIEEEIKQERFRNEYHKLLINLIYTGNWLNLLNIQYMQNFDLSPQQYNIMRILKGRHPEPATISILQERMLDKTSNASRLVEKLRLKKLVKRSVKKDDRRCAQVSLTDKGLALLNEIEKTIDNFERYVRTLDEQEAQDMNRLLDKLRNETK